MGEPVSPEVSPWPVDARGQPCPIPIAMLARALKDHPLVELKADDPAARGDVEAFCRQAGVVLESLETRDTLTTALVRRPR